MARPASAKKDGDVGIAKRSDDDEGAPEDGIDGAHGKPDGDADCRHEGEAQVGADEMRYASGSGVSVVHRQILSQ